MSESSKDQIIKAQEDLIEAQKNSIKFLNKIYDNSERKYDELLKRYSESEGNVTKKLKLGDDDGDGDNTMKQLNEALEQNKILKQNYSSMKGCNDALQKKVNDQNKAIDDSKDRFTSLHKEYDLLLKDFNELMERADSQRINLNDTNAQLEAWKLSCDSKDVCYSTLQKDNDKLKGNLKDNSDVAQRRYDELVKKYDKLKEDLKKSDEFAKRVNADYNVLKGKTFGEFTKRFNDE